MISPDDLIGSGLGKLLMAALSPLGLMALKGGSKAGANAAGRGQMGGVGKWDVPEGQFSKLFEDKIGNAKVSYHVNPEEKIVDIGSLRVPVAKRGLGEGRAAMQQLLDEVDARGYSAELLASPLDSKTKVGKLVEFYKSLGFEPTGKTNYVGEPYMRR